MTGPPSLPLLERAAARGGRTAIADAGGEHGYDALLRGSASVAEALLEAAGSSDLAGARVSFMAPPGAGWVSLLWGTWRAGGIAVPLCTSHPPRELAHVLDDAGASIALAHPAHEAGVRPLAEERGVPLVVTDGMPDPRGARALEGAPGPEGRPAAGRAPPPEAGAAPGGPTSAAAGEEGGALLLYTSGTTGRPKGALHTHRSLRAQMESLVRAWEWTPRDRILHVLPLHHTHGIVNACLCALWAGAACEMLPAFDAEAVWGRFAAGAEGGRPPVTLFMAVPTIYVKLIAAWEEAPEATRRRWSEGARSLRLAVSGSAALPERTFAGWRRITGHELLERYGMTEIGMALSNPLRGERRPGTVGRPLPGVTARLVDEDGRPLAESAGPALENGSAAEPGGGSAADPEQESPAGPSDGAERPGARPTPDVAGPGEIEVRGPTLFRAYWGRPEDTGEAFREGWFRTGDVGAVQDGYWRILGRSSVDIIKSGGYKLSALEIEEALRAHPGVADCAVVGTPDPEWGERVCAAVVPARAAAAGFPEELDAWARERLAGYKVPRRWLVVEGLPRNALGKVTKLAVRAMFAAGASSADDPSGSSVPSARGPA